MRKQTLTEGIRLLFILLFIYAGLMKGLDLEQFKAEVDQSPLLMAFSEWIILIIPTIELLIAVILIFTRLYILGMFAAFTLMSLFTVYIIVILNMNEHVPCSCGGILEDMDWTTHLIFNIVFTCLAGIGVYLPMKLSNEIANVTK